MWWSILDRFTTSPYQNWSYWLKNKVVGFFSLALMVVPLHEKTFVSNFKEICHYLGVAQWGRILPYNIPGDFHANGSGLSKSTIFRKSMWAYE